MTGGTQVSRASERQTLLMAWDLERRKLCLLGSLTVVETVDSRKQFCFAEGRGWQEHVNFKRGFYHPGNV